MVEKLNWTNVFASLVSIGVDMWQKREWEEEKKERVCPACHILHWCLERRIYPIDAGESAPTIVTLLVLKCISVSHVVIKANQGIFTIKIR